jgi:hypothetical protein
MERVARSIVRLIGIGVMLSSFYMQSLFFNIGMVLLLGFMGFALIMLS